jgi:hypothetical protein
MVAGSRMEMPEFPLTFIVRLTLGDGGVLSGVVERARSGEKQRFHGGAALAEVIAGMVQRETERTAQKSRTP